jgi:class 3 adenylate cyclase
VNLAARLEAHTKDVLRWVLLDGAARADLGDEFDLAPLGAEVFKGKSEAVDVYAVG